MTYLGDFDLESTFDFKFCTVNTSGVPTQLAGTPVISAYPGNSTTQLTAGITLTVDFDGVTGLNNVRVVATTGNGYATGTNYAMVITTGTVSGSSVVGYVVAHFSIRANRSAVMPTTAGRTLDVSATGEAGVDWANVGSPTTTVGLSGTTVKTATDVETDTADIQTRLPTALVSGRIDASVGAMAANVVTASAIATDAIDGDALAASALAEINTEIDTALADINLDHLVGTATGIPAIPAGTYIDMMMDDGTAVFDRTTDSLQAIRDNMTAGSGDWTTTERENIRHALGIDGTKTAPTGGYGRIGDTTAITSLATGVGAIKTKTDNLPTDPADESLLEAAIAAVQADTDNIQTRLPAALVSGRIDASVGAMAAGVVTASAIATDAIDADALAADALAEINTQVDTALADVNLDHLVGTATGIPAIPAGTYIDMMMDDGTAVFDRTTDSLQAIRDNMSAGSGDWTATEKENIRHALGVDGTKTAPTGGYGRMGDTTAITSLATGVGAIKTKTDNLPADPADESLLEAAIAGVQADTNDIQTRLPTALVSGRIDASVGAYQSGLTPLQPTVAGRTLDVSTTGEAGLDWANIGSPTTAQTLSGTSVKTATDVETDTADIQGRLPAALVSGRIDASVGAITDTPSNKIADHTLRRSFATASASSDGDTKGFRSLLGAIAKLVNKWSVSSTTLTIYEADDITSLGSQELTTSASAEPITGIDTT